MESFDAAIKAIEAAISDLHNDAVRVADRYWLFVNDHAKRSTGLESRTSLELSCTIKGNHVEARWQSISWYGQKTNRARVRKAIARDAKNFTYTDAALKAHAKDWEWPMVKMTETELKYIRRQLSHLVKSVISVRHAKKIHKIAEEKIVEAQREFDEES